MQRMRARDICIADAVLSLMKSTMEQKMLMERTL